MKDVHRIHNQRNIRLILSRHKGGSLHHPERILPYRIFPTKKRFNSLFTYFLFVKT